MKVRKRVCLTLFIHLIALMTVLRSTTFCMSFYILLPPRVLLKRFRVCLEVSINLSAAISLLLFILQFYIRYL